MAELKKIDPKEVYLNMMTQMFGSNIFCYVGRFLKNNRISNAAKIGLLTQIVNKLPIADLMYSASGGETLTAADFESFKEALICIFDCDIFEHIEQKLKSTRTPAANKLKLVSTLLGKMPVADITAIVMGIAPNELKAERAKPAETNTIVQYKLVAKYDKNAVNNLASAEIDDNGNIVGNLSEYIAPLETSTSKSD